jgi:ACR3 family arsenite transporter
MTTKTNKQEKEIAFFEKYLSVWVVLCIVGGITVGNVAGDSMEYLSSMEIAKVNVPIAILIWMMIYPMMLQVDFTSLKKVSKKPKGIILTTVVNWLIKPFTMAFFAWLFFSNFYSAFISPELAGEYIAGAILLGAAPCTAMVFVWSYLSDGDPNYTLMQVSVNDLINKNGKQWFTDIFLPKLKPLSIFALLLTLLLLFAFQGGNILHNPLIVVFIAIPLIIQTYFIFFITWFGGKKLKLSYPVCAPAAMIGASNFFELSVAVAIALFGLDSPAALVCVVEVLVEVPVMLSLVAFANKNKFETMVSNS